MVEDHSKGIGFERELSQDLSLDSLFHVADLQGIQDSIAMAMGVASIITRPDGSYFTEPSNLCSLCRDVIIPSDKGKLFCKAARENFFCGEAENPAIQICACSGLWQAGARIEIDGIHIGTWFVGQVRIEGEEDAKFYSAIENIGVDCDAFFENLNKTPVLSAEKLKHVAKALQTLAEKVSQMACQNMLQRAYIHEINAARNELQKYIKWKDAIINVPAAAIVVVNADRIISEVSRGFEALLGYDRGELVGRSIRVIHMNDTQYEQFGEQYWSNASSQPIVSTDWPVRRKDGSIVWCTVSGSAIYPGELGKGVVWYLRDITKRRDMEGHLRHLAFTDALTGLVNRSHFFTKASQLVVEANVNSFPLSVVMIDIDHFKKINDTYGHAAGDLALRVLGTFCITRVRAVDVLARMGGEEFALLLPNTNEDMAMQIANNLRISIQEMKIDELPILLTISAGVSSLLKDEIAIDAAISRADSALYKAKREGRNKVMRYDDNIQDNLSSHE